MDCTSDIVKNLNQSLNIDEENLIFRSNFGTILGEIFQNLISGGGTTIPDPRVFNLQNCSTLCKYKLQTSR